MSRPTHTVMFTLDGKMIIKKTKDVDFFKHVKGTSEFRCKKIIKEHSDA